MSHGHIFLIGYMASGKTTFGRALAIATGRRFVDLDEYVEQTKGCSVSEIFKRYGEDEFRRAETDALKLLAAEENLIIACGGGTPCQDGNMELMNRSGLTVWLDASVDVLLRRLRLESSKRPLVASLNQGDELARYVEGHLEGRLPHYSRAKLRFDSSRLENETQIAETVDKFLKLCPIEL